MANLGIIKELLNAKGMSQSDLAAKTGISLRGIEKIIKDKTARIDNIEKIAEALNVKPSLFFNDPPNQGDQLKQIESALVGLPQEYDGFKSIFNLVRANKDLLEKVAVLEMQLILYEGMFKFYFENELIPSPGDISDNELKQKYAVEMLYLIKDYTKTDEGFYNVITDIPEDLLDSALEKFEFESIATETYKHLIEREKEYSKQFAYSQITKLMFNTIINKVFHEAMKHLSPDQIEKAIKVKE